MRKPLVAAAVTLVALAALVGCVGRNPVVTLPPSPTTTPVFASDEEALAAAEAAYGEYLRVSDLIASEGGASPERIAPYVTEEQLPKELATYKYFTDNAIHTQGAATHDSTTLQQFQTMETGAKVSVYLCVDVSELRLVNSIGADVTPPTRADRTPLEVSMRSADRDPANLLISASETWSGSNFC